MWEIAIKGNVHDKQERIPRPSPAVMCLWNVHTHASFHSLCPFNDESHKQVFIPLKLTTLAHSNHFGHR